MKKVYENYDDQHVIKTYIYAKTADAYAYVDEAKTVKISAVDLAEIFVKGAIIVDGTTEYTPFSCVTTTGVATITYVKADTVPTTAILATLRSL